MLIPAYIIDELQRERASRQSKILEELQIELDIPRETIKSEEPKEMPQRGVADVDYFI